MKLKSCPFCGGKAVLISEHFGKFSVWCDGCNVRTPPNFDKNKVVQQWNSRAEINDE